MQPDVPRLAFLGICERATQVRDGPSPLWKYNVLGLKTHVISAVYPLTLRRYNLAFALYDAPTLPKAAIRIIGPTGENRPLIDISVGVTSRAEGGPYLREDGSLVRSGPGGWYFVVFPVEGIDLTALMPGEYTVVLANEDKNIPVGHLTFFLANPIPLTPDRIAAIRSDPGATKAVRAELKCTNCGERMRHYAGLERLPDLEAQGYIWHADLPDRFTCSCGTTSVDLTITRSNLPSLLGERQILDQNSAYLPLYEKSALDQLCANFSHLLNQEAAEEVFQTFIEENPVLLHPFAPQRIFYKAPILTSFKTDICILNNQRELLLVEIEKPGTRILKKDGGLAAEVQHAFDQVRDWLALLDDHRMAALECIGVRPDLVGTVRGVVVAGRDHEYSEGHLRKLKGGDYGRVRLLTYDDLLAGVMSLTRTLERL